MARPNFEAMPPVARLALYAIGLVVAFGAAFGLAGVVVPAQAVADWAARGEHSAMHPDAAAASTEPSRVSMVSGFTATLAGELSTSAPSTLTVALARGDQPVRTLQPLGADFGHLVVVAENGQQQVPVRPASQVASTDGLGGPQLSFVTPAAASGRYLLYLDFMVDGQLFTARFVQEVGHGH